MEPAFRPRAELGVKLAFLALAGFALIGLALDKTMGFRVARDEELVGVDQSEHAETGYDISPVAGGRRTTGSLAGLHASHVPTTSTSEGAHA